MDLLLDIKMKRNGFGPGEEFGDIETLGIDTITMLSELIKLDTMVNPITGRAKDPAVEKADFDNWGFTKQRLGDIIAAACELPVHVVVTAWTEIVEDDNGAKLALPKTEGKYKEVMAGRFDEVYYSEAQSGGKYIMRTSKYGVFVAGSRLGLPPVIENPSYDALMSALKAVGK